MRKRAIAHQNHPAVPMFADHDAYIAEAPDNLRPLLVQLRAQLALALPDAEEVIAYNMPGFRIGKTIIAGYAAFSKQCGLYLFPSAITSPTKSSAFFPKTRQTIEQS